MMNDMKVTDLGESYEVRVFGAADDGYDLILIESKVDNPKAALARALKIAYTEMNREVVDGFASV